MEAYGKLTREQILEDLDSLTGVPGFLVFRGDYMNNAVHSLDLELAAAMLRLGASPDAHGRYGEGYLRDLFYMFLSERSSRGEAILAMLKLLLANGADPNLVGGCNYRAVDLAMEAGFAPIVDVLVAAGADPTPREFI
ncbi:MAG: hypothetical protein JNM58_02980 [Xanthomonadaceae bacterium]|nr:hypothetical protein [Xanthomonadaceae bacterium]